MAAQCEMVVGFLVPHRCDNPALGNCRQCGRGFCEEHLEITPQGMICTACRQGLDQPVASARNRADLRRRRYPHLLGGHPLGR